MRSGLVTILLTGPFLLSCADNAHRVQGTDLPGVPSTQVRETSVKSVQGRAEEGRILFSGSIYDALERIRWTGRGFKADGWTQRTVTGTPREATALFTSPWSDSEERLAVLHVVADPVHGTATVTVSTEPSEEVEARIQQVEGTSSSGEVPRDVSEKVGDDPESGAQPDASSSRSDAENG